MHFNKTEHVTYCYYIQEGTQGDTKQACIFEKENKLTILKYDYLLQCL